MTTPGRRNNGRRGANAVPRILIVEDEPAVRFSLRVACEREGWQTVEATTGEQALAAVGRQRPDLVLLDIMLPDMSGLDVCRQIRLEDRLVPIIMVSARGDEVDKIVGLELGADDYVTKPFSVRELVARVRAGLRRAAAESERRTVLPAPGTVPQRTLTRTSHRTAWCSVPWKCFRRSAKCWSAGEKSR